ncbi:apolipoprotein Bb, tandem duplicate 1 isoform X1 [Danio rerio]|uniref:Apolipoprotein Bb, tandem duplicate 1 isoform X1 n=6 Tax=Bilateria TaxID=33213 RepID=A0A8M2B7H0_DANRE|nr:apolipoprotein Bb, tandem duplicate 1 isoform X1 [Danio rerio]|eukprot:XP_005160686.1 apolipoprotein Bb, tandem duplicate 1 isoform X1 [Danio rerio]
MGGTKLCLLLLLCAIALSYAQEEEPCLLAKRFKSFQKYEYTYETESLNALNGAINGPKARCKVEIEVPRICSYIVHTTECELSDVIDVDAEGKPIFMSSAGAEAFKAAMAKNPLKFTVEGDNDIKLFPENDEPANILNFKRGLISALAAPVLEEDRNRRMPTVYGMCRTDYSVNARQDIATDVVLNRDLSNCDKFSPVKDHTSPLALITGMQYPLAQLIRSSQTCNYKFDNDQKHMTSASCSEKHMLLPFSYKGEHGVSNVGKQALTLVGVSVYNGRIFDHNEANMKTLHLDDSIDSVHPIQDKDAILSILRDLNDLSETTNGENRAHLAHKLISTIRKMSAESLSAALPEALEISRPLVYQALFQCGTPECTSAILRVLRTFDRSSVEIDAAVYAMGMVPNPSRDLVEEMLEMAKFKSSKPIYYALSNAVKRLYEVEKSVTPEIKAVADYTLEQIGDCTGNQEHVYLSLRVIGNMAAAVGAASPALKSAVIQCINQPAASPEVQQAAIQVFRLTSVPDEGREVLMKVIFDKAAPIQKRVAAYLIVMKDPQPTELAQLVAALPNNKNCQAMSFVNSHLRNILSSTTSETGELRVKILNALQGNEISTSTDPTKFSRNYKIGSLEGNVIFESEELLPNEVILEMTLNAFGYDVDMFEIGLNGKGLEPTVDALIGIDGFFRDTMQKTINYAADKVPRGNDIMQSMFPTLWNNIKMQKAPQSIVKEITNNVNKLIQKLKVQDNPEAMIYLRLLGAEMGYLKTNDVEDMAYSAALLTKSLLNMFPTDFLRNLYSSVNNNLFLHYVFMDNEFYLPTGTGIPLRVALSGTFAPGVKGGLKLARDMSEVAFMPSAGVEFVTEVGALLPEYVESGLEMHTNIYHESGLKVKVAVTNKQFKLTIPTPKTSTKLISVSNSLYSVTGTEIKRIPPLAEHVKARKCTPFIPGFQYCGVMQYSNAFSNDAAPYFPLTGDSKFAIEIHPTGEVSSYTATADYAYDGKDDTVTFGLKAEGITFESIVKLTFDRQNYEVSADVQIPDYDLEAGIRVHAVDRKAQSDATHSIQIDLMKKNVPEASLIGLAKIGSMKDAMLQVQLLIPNFETDAKVTATLKNTDELKVELESDIKLPEMTSSIQKMILKYDAEEIEAEVSSDVTTEIHNIITTDAIKATFNDILDQEIGTSDKKIRDVLTQFVEASNAYLEQFSPNIPYVQELRIPALPEFTFPKKLFLNAEGAAKYKFGQNYYTITIPVPLGGKTSRDFNLPAALETPVLNVPQLDLQVKSINIPLPVFFIPESLSLSLPLVAKAEVSSKLSSNFYDMEAKASAGSELVDKPTYSAMIEVTGTSPVDLLSFKIEGSTFLVGRLGESLKTEMKSSLNHKLLEASVNYFEEITTGEKITMKSSSKMEAKSPFGLKISLEHTGQVGLDEDEISGDGNLLGSIKAGPLNGEVALRQSLILLPFKPELKIDSSLKVDLEQIQAENIIEAAFANGELSFTSKSTAFQDNLIHVAELAYKESQLALKSDARAKAFGLNIQNVAEASASFNLVNVKIDTNVDTLFGNRVRSQFIAALDANGLDVKSDASANLDEHTASHMCSLSLTRNGLVTIGSTLLECPDMPLTLQNKFNGALDTSGLSLSVETKGKFVEVTIENTNSLSASLSSVDFISKANSDDGTYVHDFSLQLQPYSTSLKISNNLNALNIKLINEAQFKALPYAADLTGSWKLSSGTDELKNTYEIKYEDLVATAKCGLTGKLMGSHMSQNTEIEVAGLSVTYGSESNFNSQYLRFNSDLHAAAVPFRFNVDAMVNADGDLYLYGKQSAQVYSKFLMKAEPLAFAHSHECRVSTTYNLYDDLVFETNLDNKIDTVLTPSEQKATVRVKSKFNNHEFNKDLSAYNTPERLGVEMSGSIITNIFNTVDSDNQDHFFSAFLKYDKNSNSRALSLPFIDEFPFDLQHMKLAVLRIVEAMQSYINREEIIVEIQKLATYVSDFVNELNLEEKIIKFSKDLTALYEDYGITLDDLEASLMNLKPVLLKLVTELDTYVVEIEKIVREIITSGTPSDAAIQRFTDILNSFNEKYDVKAIVLTVIEAIEKFLREIDVMSIKGSREVFKQYVDEYFAIKSKVEEILSELKQFVANFDQEKFTEDVKNFVTSARFRDYADNLVAKIPTEQISKILEKAKQLLNLLGNRMNAIYTNVREILVKSGVDKKIETLLKKVVELIKKFNIEETVKTLADTLKSILTPVTELVDKAINYLKTTEAKEIIEDLNNCLNHCIKYIRSFDYNAFVDEANQKIKKLTNDLYTMSLSLEIRQKLEAIREFVNYALSSMSACIEKLEKVKVVDVVKKFSDIVDSVVFIDTEALIEDLRKILADIDIREEIQKFLKHASSISTKVVTTATDACSAVMQVIQNILKDQAVVNELKQICDRVKTVLRTAEFKIPSFIFPLTDLVVPSIKISLKNLQEINLPSSLIDLPGFTILQYYTVPPIRVEYADIKQGLLDLLHFIANFEIMPAVENIFGDLRIVYMPDISAITLPEISLPEISLPEIPKYISKHKFSDLTIPEFTLPGVPTEVMVPCFGKLYGEVRVTIPIFNMRTTVEFLNSTESAETPQFVGHITSHGSSEYDLLKYTLDSTARVAMPKMSRVILAETLKITHSVLAIDHQSSVSLYGLSAQASSKSTMKITSSTYNANIVNTAFFALAGGISANIKTTYNDKLNADLWNSEYYYGNDIILKQDGLKLLLTMEEEAKGHISVLEKSDDITGKSSSSIIITPTTFSLIISVDSSSSVSNIKKSIKADGVALSYVDFTASIEGTSDSELFLLNAAGKADLRQMKVEMKADLDTKYAGLLSGTFTSAFNFLVQPFEVVLDFKNKANTKLNLVEPLSAKIDLQNNYTVILNSDEQMLSTGLLARFNQYKYSHNFTLANNEDEAGIYAAVNGEANLEFLTIPFSIPAMELETLTMVIEIPEISNINLYEQTGLKHVLTDFDQAIDVDAKMVYQKNDLTSELSFKSSIFNLNANAGFYQKDNPVIRFGVITASEFESLKAKLEGTSSLSTKSGFKLANSLLLENRHIEGTHESTATMNLNNFEVTLSMATDAKMNLPILTANANHQLTADNKANPKADSTFKMDYNFDVPIIKLVGKGNAETILKGEGTRTFISAETLIKSNIDGTFLDRGILKGTLNYDESLYVNGNSLRYALKTGGNGDLNYGDFKVAFDVDENLSVETANEHVYATMKFTSNNEANVGSFNTKGVHSSQATLDMALLKSLVADMKIDLSQPSTFGELSIFETMKVDLSAPKQKIDILSTIKSPVYTTDVRAKLDGNAPDYKTVLKASATSPVVRLQYDLDSSMSSTMENGALVVGANAVLTHQDFTMDISNAIRMSERSHILNVDITSQTFTDVNLRYAARSDGISGSVSTPGSGLLGFQLQGNIPSQMNARLYCRYAFAPDDDVDILSVRAVPKGDEKVLLVTGNIKAAQSMFEGLMNTLEKISFKLAGLAREYGLAFPIFVADDVYGVISNGLSAARRATPGVSELSQLFRNVVVTSQKTIQVLIDNAIVLVKEISQYKLPGMNEATLAEICKKIQLVVVEMLRNFGNNLEVYFSPIMDNFNTIQLTFPNGKVMTVAEFQQNVQSILRSNLVMIADAMKQIESPDVVLKKLGQTLQEVVEKGQEFVDKMNLSLLEDIAAAINTFYQELMKIIEDISEAVIFGFSIPAIKIYEISQNIGKVLNANNGIHQFELPLPFFQ